MDFSLHNTLSGNKERFIPLVDNRVGMYLCGPTVYDFIHIGNARPLVIFDILYRYLRYVYGDVCYVRNITDIDDKINQRAFDEGISIGELTSRTIEQFREDACALNCLPPTHEPLATEHIVGMVEIVERLLGSGHAYEAEGHVLFDTLSMADYGVFAGISQSDLRVGSRAESLSFKRCASDFVLWKPSEGGLIGWDSPFGYGRPGWHLECSAMSRYYLGGSFDLHLGGQDLIFPHHQNEIAQSCCAFPDDSFARYWMHNGYVLSDGEKMSKSLGNFHTVRDLLRDYSGESLRLLLLRSHYRHPLDFSYKRLDECRRDLDSFYEALDRHGGLFEGGDDYFNFSYCGLMLDALSDDLNTPLAYSSWRSYLHDLNRTGSRESYLSVCAGAKLLGLLDISVESWLRGGSDGLDSCAIESFIAERAVAKAGRDFALADEIREKLRKSGIELKDSAEGTTWRRV